MHPAAQRLIQAYMNGASRLAYLRFKARAGRAGDINRALLMTVLERQKGTDFGRRHGFAKIQGARDFQRAVPLATYEDFRGDIERMARGEPNVLTADPVIAFAVTSGTTGKEKLIPLTKYTFERISELQLCSRGVFLEALPAAREPGSAIVLMSAALRGKTEGGHPTGSLTALGMISMLKKSWIPLLSPPQVYQVRRLIDALYLHLLFALAEPKVRSITAPFASGVLDFMQLFEARWPSLVDDLARGTLHADIEIPPELGDPIRARLKPHPERARAVAREAERGMNGIARRLWPGLAYVSTVTTGSFAIYAEKLDRYLGGVPMYSYSYMSSEAFLGMSAGVGAATTYTLLPGSAFFEFIPADEMDAPEPKTKLIDELTPGERYEIVVTTFGGLYRYRMGDVVEVTRYYKRVPVVAFLYRRGSLLNIAGEKTSEHAARLALTQALAKEGLELVDFSAMEDTEQTPKRYVFFVEIAPRDRAMDVERITETIEQGLREANPFYLTLRARLGPILVVPVKPGAFAGLRELLIQRGANASQVKVPRLVIEGPLAEFLRKQASGGAEAVKS